MRITGMFLLVLMGGMAVTAHAKNKKDAVPRLFCQARYAYVQTVNGDPLSPNVVPEDRTAANALIAQIGDWKRYVVVKDPSQADLVFVVRTGRVATLGSNNGGNSGGGRQNPNAGMNQDPSGMSATPNGAGGQGRGGMSGSMGGVDDELSAASNNNRNGSNASLGSPNDILAIYQRPNGEPLTSPLWQRTEKNGLQAPKGTLFEQVKTAVDATCVNQPAAAPPPAQ
jgi:hypothetical protein